jgi:hypothetical protein
MRWFRSHSFALTSLALFALACQFVLSFGHVHLGSANGSSIHWTYASAAGKAAVTHVGKTSAAHAEKVAKLPGSTKPQKPNGLGDDYCAVCANISLANALTVPVAPAPLDAVRSFTQLHWSFAALEIQSIDHFHFNARGPPAV